MMIMVFFYILTWRENIFPSRFTAFLEIDDKMDRNQGRSAAIRDGRYLSFAGSFEDLETAANHDAMQEHTLSILPKQCESLPSSIRTLNSAESSQRNSAMSQENTFRQSLLPSPLNPGRSVVATKQDQQHPVPPARVYGGAAGKVKEQFGVEEIEVDFSYLAPLMFSPGSRPPPRTFRSSLHRLSLTTSEMPYPISLLRAQDAEANIRAEQMLGLRRQSMAPPVPPKDPRRDASTSSNSSDSLPLHKKSVPEDTLEPLNGRTAWLHTLTGMLVVFNCWGLNNAYGLFQVYYEKVHLRGTSPSAIAWIGSTQLALVFGLGVPVGRLVDRGYFRLVFHGGSLIMVLGLFLTSICTNLWSVWLVNGLVTGFGMVRLSCL